MKRKFITGLILLSILMLSGCEMEYVEDSNNFCKIKTNNPKSYSKAIVGNEIMCCDANSLNRAANCMIFNRT